MSGQKKIRDLVSVGGILTSRQVRDAGIHPYYLQQLVRSGELQQVSRGIYIRSDAWEDDIFIFQQRYQRGIFSHDNKLNGIDDEIQEILSGECTAEFIDETRRNANANAVVKRIETLKEIAQQQAHMDNLSEDLTENIAQTY